METKQVGIFEYTYREENELSEKVKEALSKTEYFLLKDIATKDNRTIRFQTHYDLREEGKIVIEINLYKDAKNCIIYAKDRLHKLYPEDINLIQAVFDNEQI